MAKQKSSHVIITVSGGVAEIAELSRGTVVDIIDYDNLKETPAEDFNRNSLSRRAQSYLKKTERVLWEQLYALPTPYCQHALGEDCMICDDCGRCSEALDDAEICDDCRENKKRKAQAFATEMLEALEAVRDNWETNLTNTVAQVNGVIDMVYNQGGK